MVGFKPVGRATITKATAWEVWKERRNQRRAWGGVRAEGVSWKPVGSECSPEEEVVGMARLRMERSENPAGVGQHGGLGDSSGQARQVRDRARAEVWWGWAIWGDIAPGEQSRKRSGGGWEEGELPRKPAGKPPVRQGGGLAPCHSSCSVFTKALLCPVPSLAHAREQ